MIHKIRCANPKCRKRFESPVGEDEDMTKILCMECWTKNLVYGDPNHDKTNSQRGKKNADNPRADCSKNRRSNGSKK